MYAGADKLKKDDFYSRGMNDCKYTLPPREITDDVASPRLRVDETHVSQRAQSCTCTFPVEQTVLHVDETTMSLDKTYPPTCRFVIENNAPHNCNG